MESHNKTFALTSTGMVTVDCGLELISTEHPKLWTCEEEYDILMAEELVKDPARGILTYVNSKFLYVSNHFKEELQAFYADVLYHRCRLESKLLLTILSIAVNQPDEFAYQLYQQPGYTAVYASEAAHIFRCIPVEVELRDTDQCFLQLPVSNNNQSYFLMPRTRILVQTGVEVPCSPQAPPMFHPTDGWYAMMPKLTPADAPVLLRPNDNHTYTYRAPANLGTSGIYTNKELTGTQQRMTSFREGGNLLIQFSQDMVPKEEEEPSLYDLFTLNYMDVVQAYKEKLYKHFMHFGNICAGLIGILMTLRLVFTVFGLAFKGITPRACYTALRNLAFVLCGACGHFVANAARAPRLRQQANRQRRRDENPEEGGPLQLYPQNPFAIYPQLPENDQAENPPNVIDNAPIPAPRVI